ncbi:MAG: alpha/beta fold hydrolase [Acidimicrobiales bacterium]
MPASDTPVPARAQTADGVDIAVHDLGGSGPLLVLAHATGLHAMVWAPMAAHLGDAFQGHAFQGHAFQGAAFHCVALDERGHGDSGVPPNGEFDWRGFALDILAAGDALGLGAHQALGLGHSSGGTAMLLAEQARPGTFAAIYCFEPIVVAADPPLGRDRGNWLAAGARRRRETFASRDEALAHYAAKASFSSWDPEALAAYVDHGFDDLADGTVALKCRREDEALVYEMASAHDGFAHMGEVRCPVLLASGADTDAVGASSVDVLARRLPAARTEVIPGVGHFGPLEDPAAVAASVRAFFRDLGSGDSGGARW